MPILYRASARDRRPSFALRQSVNSQRKKRGRGDPEPTAIVANCGVIEDEDAPKKIAKEMNTNFFNGLAKIGTIEICRISFLFLRF